MRAHIWVNVPESRLRLVVDTANTELDMPVIVGHPDRPTPSFASDVRQIVFHPFWSIPRTIAVEDLLPRQQREEDFFARSGIRVLPRPRATTTARLRPPASSGRRLNADRFPIPTCARIRGQPTVSAESNS